MTTPALHDDVTDDTDLDPSHDFASPPYDWSSDYLWCEEQAMASLDTDDVDDDDAEYAADRALRAAEAESDDEVEEDDDTPPVDDEDDL